MPAGAYYYRIVAVDTASQTGPPSSQVAVTVTTPGSPPSAPGTLTAGGRLDRAELRFGLATGVNGVSHYQLHRSGTAGFTPTARTRIANISTSIYTDYPLENGVYHYRVIAVDYAGQIGPPSNEASATIPDEPPTTPALTVQAGAGKAELSWTAATDDHGVTGYEVWRSSSSDPSPGSTGSVLVAKVTTPAALTAVDTGLSADRYHYRVLAVDTAGQPGEPSATATAEVTQECPPAACLVAAYGFDVGAGTAVADSSGAGNNGTATATTWAAGKYGKALSYTVDSAQVLVPDSPSLRMDTAMTLEAWVYPTQITWTHPVLIKGSDQDSSYELYAAKSTTGAPPSGPAAWVGAFGGARGVGDTTVLPPNTWTHLAATFSAGTLRLYVNGVEVRRTESRIDPIKPDTDPLRIGRYAIYGEYFKGLIDEIRIYSTPLTAAQIQADMSAPISVS
jgi:hypothetical protein